MTSSEAEENSSTTIGPSGLDKVTICPSCDHRVEDNVATFFSFNLCFNQAFADPVLCEYSCNGMQPWAYSIVLH